MNLSIQHTPNQDAADLVDSLSVMIEQESTTYCCRDYLNSDDIERADGNKITPDDRMKIVDWCYQIVDRCQFKRETVAVAMNLVDRFMCANASAHQARDALYNRGKYQLVAVTALYMSIKVNECVAFGIDDFAALSNGTYSVEDIQDMEWSILQGLSWRVNPPTSLQVGHRILSLMESELRARKTSLTRGTWDYVREEVAFNVESSVRDYYFSTRRPSTIAAAAILNVIEQVDDRDYRLLILALLPILQEFGVDPPHALKDAMDKLLCMTSEAPEEPRSSLHASCCDVACTDNCDDFCITEDIERC